MSSKTGFNKYNAPELMGQLIAVLDKEGLDDAVNQIRMKKIPQMVDKAWKKRDKTASEKVADRYLQSSCGGSCGCGGNCENCQCRTVADRYLDNDLS